MSNAKVNKLSPTQVKAVDLAKRGGLMRAKGGYWVPADSYPKDGKVSREQSESGEWITAHTVSALERRGVLTAVGDGPEYSRRRVLVEAWR